MDERGTVVASVVTAADGRYRTDDLEPGTYTAVASGHAPATARVDVQDGQIPTWDAALEPGANLPSRQGRHAVPVRSASPENAPPESAPPEEGLRRP